MCAQQMDACSFSAIPFISISDSDFYFSSIALHTSGPQCLYSPSARPRLPTPSSHTDPSNPPCSTGASSSKHIRIILQLLLLRHPPAPSPEHSAPDRFFYVETQHCCHQGNVGCGRQPAELMVPHGSGACQTVLKLRSRYMDCLPSVTVSRLPSKLPMVV